MEFKNKVISVQQFLINNDIDGWLLYDFRRTNDLACKFLEIPTDSLCTRRFFYWIPKEGNPIKIVHRIESHILSHLPGESYFYSSWEEFENTLGKILFEKNKVAMEYSPKNAIPYVSKVDGGTIDLVRSYGAEVVSSADLLQGFTSVLTPMQVTLHKQAAEVLDQTVSKAWSFISDSLRKEQKITEYDVQQFILNEFEKEGCKADDPPICAVNENSANPHYSPQNGDQAVQIKKGDFVLIDLWCKLKKPHAVYADITRVGVIAKEPTDRQIEIFDIVKQARDTAMDLIAQRLKEGKDIMGWEVDAACRKVIEDAGFGQYFTHRTGHNIYERDHGDGANIDNFETQDKRRLLPSTCFSIEPGIYLPGEFGVRLEHDVFIEPDGRSCISTGSPQPEIFLCC